MIGELLANATAADPDMISGKVLIAVIGAIGALITGVLSHQAGKRQSFKIEGQPLAVKMEDHFVTRREFENLEGRIRADVVEMKGLFQQTMSVIERRDKSLSDKIESVASSAYEGRRRLHDKANDHGERIKSIEDRMPVKRAILAWEAARSESRVCAEIRSMTPSAWVRSSLPLRKARRVNSPGPAGTAPQARKRPNTSRVARMPPWPVNSTVLSNSG